WFKTMTLVVGGAAAGLAVLIGHRVLLETIRSAPAVCAAFAGAPAGVFGLFVVLAGPSARGDKFLGQSALPIGGLLAPVLSRLALRAPFATIALTGVLSLGAVSDQAYRFDWTYLPTTRARGLYGQAADEGLRLVTVYLRESTPVDSVVLTNEAVV